MGRIGLGYGSEWHLLWYLGRHRTELTSRIADAVGASSVDWLDFPTRKDDGHLLDAEWKGLDFLTNQTVLDEWRKFWPQRAGVQNWDAVGRVCVDGINEWLLVEAKGHLAEISSNCAAKPEGGLGQITKALEETKCALGVQPTRDWLNGHYQFANRLAVLHFLESQGVHARLLFMYFTGDSTEGRDCPRDEGAWTAALAGQDAHLGLPVDHTLSRRVHRLFLPIFPNLRRAL